MLIIFDKGLFSLLFCFTFILSFGAYARGETPEFWQAWIGVTLVTLLHVVAFGMVERIWTYVFYQLGIIVNNE